MSFELTVEMRVKVTPKNVFLDTYHEGKKVRRDKLFSANQYDTWLRRRLIWLPENISIWEYVLEELENSEVDVFKKDELVEQVLRLGV